MKFLFINPPYVIGEDGMAVLPNKAMLPVGPLSIASAIEARGHEVIFADLVFQMDWRKYISHIGIDFDRILICCHTARNIITVKAVLDFLREQSLQTHTTIGGNLTHRFGIDDFSKFGIEVDAVVREHGYDIIDSIIDGMRGNTKKQQITPAAIPLPNLLLLDNRARVLYRKHSNGRYPIVGPGGFGCLWYQRCNSCDSQMGTTSTPRLLRNILTEVDLAARHGYRDFWCVDNLVNVFPETLMKFDKEIHKKDFVWSGMTRPELATKQASVFGKLKACTEIAMGVESKSVEQLQTYNRGAKKDYFQQITDAFRIIRRSGINTTAFVMLDGENETEESFWKLYQFLKHLNATSVSWSFYNPPATIGLLKENRSPNEYGFYRWPMGCSGIPPKRVVQQAMILSGTWWKGWQLNESDPFFENDYEFGVRFQTKNLSQPRHARSPIGDIWEVWEEQDI